MTTTPHPADALPLPELENIGDPSCYGYSEHGVRAYGRQCYELAKHEALQGKLALVQLYNEAMASLAEAVKERDEQARLLGMGSEREARLMAEVAELRKAQEGREPVARVELMTTGGNVGIATRIVEIDDPLRERLRHGALLYDYPPPKSSDAMDAQRYRLLRDFDSGMTELAICRWSEHGWVGEWVIEHDPDAAIDAALATQQKGGAV